jgi:hypothetical protein
MIKKEEHIEWIGIGNSKGKGFEIILFLVA